MQTLKRPQAMSRMESAMSSAPQVSGDPLLVINTALAPQKDKLSPLDIGPREGVRGSVTAFPPGGMWNMIDLVDPLLVADRDGANQSHDLFKASYWSPAGYNHLGG